MKEIALGAYVFLFAADGRTTAIGLRDYGAREIFLTQHATANALIVAGEAGALWYWSNKVQRPWIKWSVRFGVAGVHGIAAAHNLREMSRAKGIR